MWLAPWHDLNLIRKAEIENVRAFEGAFGAVYDVTTASVQAVAVLAAEPVFPAVFRHRVAVALAARKTVRELIRGTAACDLPAVPVGFPSGS